MRKIHRSTITLGLAMALLGGCSTRHATLTIKAIGDRASSEQASAQDFIAAGRNELGQRNFGLAIGKFREALRVHPDSAAALNGLGIAYASIGRDDLAQRYFERAIAFAPEMASYRRNLDRLAARTETGTATAQAAAAPREADPVVAYRLRQDPAAPVARASAPAGVILAANPTGLTLITRPTATAAAEPAPTFSLERAQVIPSTYSLAPVLRRVSIREVHIGTRRPADVLAEGMRRDYFAEWERRDAAPRAQTGSAVAFRAAISDARQRLARSETAMLTGRDCAAVRFPALLSAGSVQCP